MPASLESACPPAKNPPREEQLGQRSITSEFNLHQRTLQSRQGQLFLWAEGKIQTYLRGVLSGPSCLKNTTIQFLKGANHQDPQNVKESCLLETPVHQEAGAACKHGSLVREEGVRGAAQAEGVLG